MTNWGYAIIKNNDEYGVFEVERDIDGEVLDIISHPIVLRGYSSGELLETLDNIVRDLMLHNKVLETHINSEFDDDQFELDPETPLDEAFR